MIPIIKIRLLRVKHEYFSFTCQYFYPLILCGIIIFEVSFALKDIAIVEVEEEYKYDLFTPKEIERQASPKEFEAGTIFDTGVICKNDQVAKKMSDVLNEYFMIKDNVSKIYTFEDEEKYLQFIKSEKYLKEKHFIYTLFDIAGDDPKNLSLRIKDNSLIYKSPYSSVSPLNSRTIMSNNNIRKFISFQEIMAQLLKGVNNLDAKKTLRVETKKLTENKPKTSYFSFLNQENTSSLIPIMVSLGYSALIFNLGLWMVTDKEQKLKEFLMRQGITQKKYYFSWFITFVILNIVPVISLTAFLYFTVFNRTFFFTLLGFQAVNILNIFVMACLFQSFSSNVKISQSLMKILYFGITISTFAILRPEVPRALQYFFLLFPPTVLVAGFQTLLKLSLINTIDWELFKTPYNGISLLHVTIFTVFNLIFYSSIILIYLLYENSGLPFSKFIKDPFGRKKEKEYQSLIPESPSTESDVQKNHEKLSEKNQVYKSSNNFLNIRNVFKNFDSLVAVNNFCGEIFPNEIFCLLGHNGAGKTTLIKMISGSEIPNEGDILLNGRSLVTNRDYLFESIGLCSQENILFEYLTVEEHLKIMCDIKGEKVNKNEINDLIQKLGLVEKRSAQCKTLSGGQKRKLCLALALIGQSKLILLDEPTSGMDVSAKRLVWDFLKGYKKDKIIILTTHSLEEAEYLGDRIGIMSEGQFLCSGTTSYLKSKYPCGYNVNILFPERNQHVRDTIISELKNIDSTLIVKFSSKEVLSLNFMNMGDEIDRIFQYIDQHKEEFKIYDYTVSTTSLEDVFIKLNNNELSKDLFNTTNDDAETEFKEGKSKNVINDSEKEGFGKEFSIPVPFDESEKRWGFFSEFGSNIKRNFIVLFRTKGLFILELASQCLIIYLYAICLKNFNIGNSSYQDLSYLLKANDIYFQISPELGGGDFLLNSQYVKNHPGIKLKQIPFNVSENFTRDELQTKMFEWSKNHLEKSLIGIKKDDDNKIVVYNLYRDSSSDYFQATMNMILSAFMEKYYGIYSTFGEAYSNPILSGQSVLAQILDIALKVSGFFVFFSIFCSFGGLLLMVPLSEKVRNIKQVLYLSGSNMISYWGSLLVVDFIKFLFFTALILPPMIYFSTVFCYFIPVILFYIISSNIFGYFFTFLCSKEENGQKFYLLFCSLTGMILPLFSLIIRLSLATDIENNSFTSDKFLFTESDLLPMSSFLISLIRIGIFGLVNNKNMAFLIVNHCVNLVICSVFYVFLLLLCEKRILGTLVLRFLNWASYSRSPVIVDDGSPLITDQSGISEDPNEREMSKIKSGIQLSVIISGLKKTYFMCCGKNVQAVRKLYLGIEPNEKFGLLGYNGSGKTTTFKSITNEILYEEGEIILFGKKTLKNFNEIRRDIGYCPQENALFEYLTVEEILKYYINLKRIKLNVNQLCEKFGLEQYLKTYVINLSGGNKRKLMFAIALMGHPKVLLLDEPSTGVDPESRRMMWKNINSLSNENKEYVMILSTHSMEEAEILCDTVSWLKSGRFSIIGNPEKLKIRFSEGYKIHVKFEKGDSEDVEDTEFLTEHTNNKSFLIKTASEETKTYFGKLTTFIRQLSPLCVTIYISEVCNDSSFNIKIIKRCTDSQGENLFAKLLKMKNENGVISEISINMESLEDILTKYDILEEQ